MRDFLAEKRYIGSNGGSCRPARDFPIFLRWYKEGMRHFGEVHSEVQDVATIARDAGVRRLVLTHLLSGEEPDELQAIAASIFKGEMVVAYDGMSFDV